MKKTILLALLVCSMVCYAQNNFKKGYFIDNLGAKTICLIKDLDWANTPTEFEYKLNEFSKSNLHTITSVLEFSVSSYVFKRYSVDIDRSGGNIRHLSSKREPEFVRETVFLKELIKGNASLYSYSGKNLKLFFFGIHSDDLEPLVYKEYSVSADKVNINDYYKMQLLEALKCEGITFNDIKRVKYQRDDLVDFFIRYNSCKNPDFKIDSNKIKGKKGKFNLHLKPGVTFSSLSLERVVDFNEFTNLGNQTGFRIGVEAEYVLGLNNNKWAFLFETVYNSEHTAERPLRNVANLTSKFQSIFLSLGARHYMFLNDDLKLFVNAAYEQDIVSSSSKLSVIYPLNTYDFEYQTRNSFGFGLGANYKKISLELRTSLDRDVLKRWIGWGTKFSYYSIIIGYNILK